MSKPYRDNYCEKEWEERINSRVEAINHFLPMDGFHFDTNYAYGGCRLTKVKDGTGGAADLSRRYYYDDEEEADYDDMCAMLDAIIAVLKAKRDNEQGKNEW